MSQPSPAMRMQLILLGVMSTYRAIRHHIRMLDNRMADEFVAYKPDSLPAKARHFFTGGILAFPASGKPFGEEIKLVDKATGRALLVKTGVCRSATNSALYLPPGSFTWSYARGTVEVSPGDAWMLIPNFPQHSGWYPFHLFTYFPVTSGGKTDAKGERMLIRDDEAWVGLATRSVNEGEGQERKINASHLPSFETSVLVYPGIPPQQPEREPNPASKRTIILPGDPGFSPPPELVPTPPKPKNDQAQERERICRAILEELDRPLRPRY